MTTPIFDQKRREATRSTGQPKTPAAPIPARGGAAAAGAFPAALPPPGPADLCAEPAEQTKIALFQARTDMKLDRFVPSTGLGMFDTVYLPALSLMVVTVKLHLNFVEADNAPDYFTLVGMIAAGQDISRFFWSEAEKQEFRDKFVQRVISRWSLQHPLHSTKPCWNFVAYPLIMPVLVEAAGNPHFSVTVYKSSGPGLDYKSAGGYHDPTDLSKPASTTLWQSDVRESPDFQSKAVARSERIRLESALAAANAGQTLFAQNKAEVTPAEKADLLKFAEALRAKNPSDPAIPVIIEGFASAEGKTTLNQGLSERRAFAVQDILDKAGIPQSTIASGSGPVGAPDDAANRRVDIRISHTAETTYSGNRYSVAEHEFGHLLGLPDEYSNNTTGKLGDIQSKYIPLANQAKTPLPPGGFGVDTSSQMADGVDVLPRHYVTLWEALGKMTTPAIGQNEWKID